MTLIRLTFLSAALIALLPTIPMADEPKLAPWLESELELIPKDSFRVILEPRYSTTLSAGIESVVSVISYRLGEAFQADDLLIQLNAITYEATHRKAVALHERAKAELRIREELFVDEVASELEVAEARASKVSAEADMILAREQLNDCTLTAPYQGKVVDVFVEEHEMVRPGQPLIEIVDDTVLLAKMLIPARYLKDLSLEDEIQIRLMDNHETVTAVVKRIGAVIDPASSMVKVHAEIDNSDSRLRAGMIGTTNLDQKAASPLGSESEAEAEEE